MKNAHHGSGRLTDADHERIYQLAERGLGAGIIARELGRHPSAVQWFLYSEGLRAPVQLADGKPSRYMRNGRTVYLYTQEEDAFIEALRIQSFDFHKIAELSSKRFGIERKAHSVQCRLIMLAARDAAESP